jgi:magnesium chelatase accessory protein
MTSTDLPDWDALRASWPNAASSRFIEAAGVRWHVQVAGTGPAVLLLHGTGGASHSWGDVLPLLSRDRTVIVPDLPGQGFSSALPEPPTVTAMARAVRALCAALTLEPASAAGHSAGAAILLAMARDAMLPLTGIAGFGAALVAPPAMYRELVAPLINPLVTSSITARIGAAVGAQRFIADTLLSATGSPVPEAQRARYRALFAAPAHVRGAMALMAHWDLAGLMDSLASAALPPITLVHGTRDAFVPITALRAAAARMPSATVVAWEGAGHLLHEERPSETEAVIRAIG